MQGFCLRLLSLTYVRILVNHNFLFYKCQYILEIILKMKATASFSVVAFSMFLRRWIDCFSGIYDQRKDAHLCAATNMMKQWNRALMKKPRFPRFL